MRTGSVFLCDVGGMLLGLLHDAVLLHKLAVLYAGSGRPTAVFLTRDDYSPQTRR